MLKKLLAVLILGSMLLAISSAQAVDQSWADSFKVTKADVVGTWNLVQYAGVKAGIGNSITYTFKDDGTVTYKYDLKSGSGTITANWKLEGTTAFSVYDNYESITHYYTDKDEVMAMFGDGIAIFQKQKP